MMSPALVLGASFGYLLLLFAIAAYADRRADQGRSIIDNAGVYALSWGVYCTAWTYFGSVGRAASGGVWFLPIYLGPMLAMLLAWVVLRKMVRISQTYRITSIADFIASRYGKSPLLAAVVTLITVVGMLPYIALQLKAVSAGYDVLTANAGTGREPGWWLDGTFYVALLLAAFAIIFGTRHLDQSERHEGMVAAVAFESGVKLLAFLAVGGFVTWGLFDGMADIWARAQQMPEITRLLRLDNGAGSFSHAQWFAMIVLAMLSVLLLPRQFQVMVVECVNERHIRRAAWLFPVYLLLINIFVLPIAIGGLVLFGSGVMDPETFVLSVPLYHGAGLLALVVYIGGLSAVTGMLIVETVAVSTMVCNDLVTPALLRSRRFARRSGGDLTRLLLNIRRAAILTVLLLGYLYYRIAGEAYALVSIGLISFAAVAQFAPALLGGMYWKGGTRTGALAGLTGGALVWAWTLMLPSVAKSGWIDAGFLDGPFGLTLLAPESLFGLTGLDYLTHSLFWSMLVNIGLYVGLSLARDPSPREASQAVLFVDVYETHAAEPVFWRGRARLADLRDLAGRFLGAERAQALFHEHARDMGVAPDALVADARLVDRVERQIAGAVGTASARVMVESVAQEEPLTIDNVLDILDEASQVRSYARQLEQVTSELRDANEELKSLDQLKDDFMSSVTHELRTPLTSIRALAEPDAGHARYRRCRPRRILGIILKESERLGRLVNQVLDLAKIEAGMAEWNTCDIDLRQLVADSLRATSELFREKGAEVVADLAPDLPPVQADPDRMMQVMMNLLSNAAKFVPVPGGRVDVSLSRQGDGLVVSVRDNGRGVDPAEQAVVFDKFRQVGDARDRPPSAGLGLPISREIVNNLGGEMWLESEPGQGACFAFRLPLQPEGGVDEHQGSDRG
ncbi:sensor histidine kinase [Paracoccus sp. DMF-8]|uniref:sensor histidine kinase n=1 Tax=Paracoccus sp. DMF-8 TaxID=3019445 RepID=UPI0023E38128|nr:sensor histidine kinase [Paracoccus sp. DMF-8]MDF3607860.1 sensor histidine kinase [Paracoccus sp. DMF-8]